MAAGSPGPAGLLGFLHFLVDPLLREVEPPVRRRRRRNVVVGFGRERPAGGGGWWLLQLLPVADGGITVIYFYIYNYHIVYIIREI